MTSGFGSMKKNFFQKETVYHMNKQCFIIFQNWKNCCQEIHSRETAISIKTMFFWKIQQFPENKFPRTDLEWNLLLSEVNLPKFSEHFSDAFSVGTSGENWGLTIFKSFGLIFYSSGRGPRDVSTFSLLLAAMASLVEIMVIFVVGSSRIGNWLTWNWLTHHWQALTDHFLLHLWQHLLTNTVHCWI